MYPDLYGVKTYKTTSLRIEEEDVYKRQDLLFFNTSGSGVSHVGLYIGNGQMIHAANSKKGVRPESITSGYYYNKFTNARRVL